MGSSSPSSSSPALGPWGFSHWTTREVLKYFILAFLGYFMMWFPSFQDPISLQLCLPQCLCCVLPPLYLPAPWKKPFPHLPWLKFISKLPSSWGSSNFPWQSGLASWRTFLAGLSLNQQHILAAPWVEHLCVLFIFVLASSFLRAWTLRFVHLGISCNTELGTSHALIKTDGWLDGWMDGWREEWMHRWIN